MLNGKSILVIVPARGGSKGIKLKNIQPINGVPMIALTGQVVRKLDYVDRAVVSTDHPEIARIAEASGLAAPFPRPEHLAGDVIADFDVLLHTLIELEKLDGSRYDIILMLHPTSPLRKPEQVTSTVEKLISGGYDAVWSVNETDSKNHPLKQLTINDEQMEYYETGGENIIARQQLKPVYHRNGVCYAFTRECLVEQKTIKGRRTSVFVVEEPMVSIDTMYDLKLVEFIMSNFRGTDDSIA